MERYSPRQVRILAACFAAYTAAYISRTNLSPALDAIAQQFGLTAGQVGLLPTLFAIPYAAGQIVSGALADRFRARNFMLAGLLGSALSNIAFSCAASYPALLALWCVNGCFQSMIWTPMVRMLSQEFQASLRAKAMFFISMTLIAGYLCAWLLSGLLTSHASWRAAFRVSGTVTAVIGLGSFLALMDSHGEKAASADEPEGAPVPVAKLILGTDLIFLLILCVFNGYVRDSIMNWAPKMLVDTQGIDLSGALGAILVIPIINFLGIQAGKVAFQRLNGDVRRSIKMMMMLCADFAVLLTLLYRVHPLVCTALLALCSAMSYSLNPLLTSILPLEYRDMGRVALVAGLIDATIYVGSALSGVLAGMLHDAWGWSAVFGSWVIFSLIGVAMVVLAIRKQKA